MGVRRKTSQRVSLCTSFAEWRGPSRRIQEEQPQKARAWRRLCTGHALERTGWAAAGMCRGTVRPGQTPTRQRRKQQQALQHNSTMPLYRGDIPVKLVLLL